MSSQSISLYRMDRPRLRGRDAFASQLMVDFNAGCTIFGLEGVTGAGKSEFCFQFARLCQDGRGPHPLTIDGGVASTEPLLIGNLYRQLRAVQSAQFQGFEDKAKNFLERLVPGMRNIGGAMIQDLAKVAGLDKAEKTVEAVSNLLMGLEIEPDPYQKLAEEDESNRRMLIIEYLRFVTDLGNPLCIVVDDYELLETSAREFLKLLLRRKPENCLLLIAVNTEHEPASDWRSIFAPSIKATNGEVYAIPDLGIEEISLWYKDVTGLEADQTTLIELVQKSRGGRPAYLEKILAAARSGGPEPRIPNFDELQAARRRSLSSDAKTLGDLMALLPGDVAIPRPLLDEACHAAGINPRSAVDELYGADIVQRLGDRVQFVHSTYAISWAAELDNRRRDELEEFWYEAFSQAGYTSGDQLTGGLLALVAPRIVERQSSIEIERLATTLEEYGAQDDSMLLLTTSWQAPPGAGKAGDGMIEHALHAARLQLDLGRYAQVKEPLHAVELSAKDGTPLRNAADLLRMKLALRLNRYPIVWALDEKLAKMAASEPAVQLERELIVNTAYRDLMDVSRIEASTERLRGYLEYVDETSRAAINRSLARSFAKVGEADKALELAREGLLLASEQGDVRAIGNAHLALGEALRHANQETAALDNYRNAIDFGSTSGNRDSELWSRMGEASAHLQLGNLPKARVSLGAAEELVNEPGFEHPLESAHVALLHALIEVLEGGTVDEQTILEQYARLDIFWPKAFLEDAQVQGSLPNAIPL